MRPWRWLPAALVVALIPAPPDGVLPPFERARAGAALLAAGVHGPNRAWTELDYRLFGAGQFGAVKLMSYHPPAVYERLRRDHPHLDFVVRLDTPWHELPPPEAFVAEHAPYLQVLVAAGHRPWVEIGNEPNLELHPLAEYAFAAWYRDTLRRLRAAVPDLKYGFPGLAHDRREDAWLAANAEGIRESDWLGVHVYWTTEREMLDPQRALRLMAIHRQFPDLPMVVTEAGNYALGVPAKERARQYARFLRTMARLPYVRSAHFFILSGTPEWERFFLDEPALAAVRLAMREPVPVLDGILDGVAGSRQLALAATRILPRQAGPVELEGQAATHALPVPPPFARRHLLEDVDPFASAPDPIRRRWLTFQPPSEATPAAAALRTASGFFGTDFSLRLQLAAPEPGLPLAIQFANADAFGMSPALLAAPVAEGATGFALLWDGGAWRLQYRRDGALVADAWLAVALVPGDAGEVRAPAGTRQRHTPDQGAGWLHVEIAIEARSAAAWIWPLGTPQPESPAAVFAPPPAAATDGTRPRYVFLPWHSLASVILEGGTRD